MLFNPVLVFLDKRWLLVPLYFAFIFKLIYLVAHSVAPHDYPDKIDCTPDIEVPPEHFNEEPLTWGTAQLNMDAYLKYTWPKEGHLSLKPVHFTLFKDKRDGVFIKIHTQCAYLTMTLKRASLTKPSETFFHLSTDNDLEDENRICILLRKTNDMGLRLNGTVKSIYQVTLPCNGYERFPEENYGYSYPVGQLVIRKLEINLTRDPTPLERFESYLLKDIRKI